MSQIIKVRVTKLDTEESEPREYNYIYWTARLLYKPNFMNMYVFVLALKIKYEVPLVSFQQFDVIWILHTLTV